MTKLSLIVVLLLVSVPVSALSLSTPINKPNEWEGTWQKKAVIWFLEHQNNYTYEDYKNDKLTKGNRSFRDYVETLWETDVDKDHVYSDEELEELHDYLNEASMTTILIGTMAILARMAMLAL